MYRLLLAHAPCQQQGTPYSQRQHLQILILRGAVTSMATNRRSSAVHVPTELPAEFTLAAERLPAFVRSVLLEGPSEGDAKVQAAALLSAFNSRSSGSSEVKHIPGALTASACAKLRKVVDERRQLDKDTVDLAPTHQLNLGINELTKLIGEEEAERVYSLPGGLLGDAYLREDFRLEIMLRRYSRDTRPWIQFHCDKAAITANIALHADRLHEGGRLICVMDGELESVERDEGEATVHASSLLHAVSAMKFGVRYSLIVFFHRHEDQVLAGAEGVDASCPLLLRAGSGVRDRRAIIHRQSSGYGSAWLFTARAGPPELAWMDARERFARDGIGVIDEFVGAGLALSLHEAAYRLFCMRLSDFRSGRDGSGMRLHLTRQEQQQLPGLDSWILRLESLVSFLRQRLPELRAATHMSQPMLTIFPGCGACHPRHVENPDGRDGRILSATLYLNPGWLTGDHGGSLRIWTSDDSSVVSTIAPLLDRLALLWSDGRTPHEVMPAHRERLAVSVWFSDATCAGSCSRCGHETTRRCCGEAFYCSIDCQRADWACHKAVCARRLKS